MIPVKSKHIKSVTVKGAKCTDCGEEYYEMQSLKIIEDIEKAKALVHLFYAKRSSVPLNPNIIRLSFPSQRYTLQAGILYDLHSCKAEQTYFHSCSK